MIASVNVRDCNTGLMRDTLPEVPLPSVPIDNLRDVPACPGVYFAWAKLGSPIWQCVYVGESVNMRRRLFDRPELAGTTLSYMRTDTHHRKLWESLFIGLLSPQLNCQSDLYSDHCKAARHYSDLIWGETLKAAKSSTLGSARDCHVATACYLKVKAIRAAWKMFQREALLSIRGAYAVPYTFHNLNTMECA